MEGLTIGRIVHYVMQLPEQVGTMEYAAIVSRVHSGSDSDGTVGLHLFTENTVIVKYDVPYNADKLPGTWHWIERM